jgi:O-antigen ligase
MKSRVQLWVLFAGPLVTLALGFGWTFDNVNTVKLLALGYVAGFAAAEIILAARKSRKFLFSPAFIVAILFMLGLLVPLTLSNSPIAQQIYGTSGRNLGFLHYFFLILIFLGFSTLNARVVWPKILKSVVILGIFEAAYGCFQLLGLDILPWKNPEKWIFGTFGNPNYFSSFLSLSVIATIYFAIVGKGAAIRSSWLGAALFQGGVILFSGSSQGLVLMAFGLFAIMLNLIFRRSNMLGWMFFSLGSLTALVATFGIFQYGAMTKYVYQDSVSYRGDYWRAGIRMFSENWLHGVGLDSYGDYYRMYRDATAANRRGLDVVSDSAHNLFIDLAATGGIFLLVGYLLILGLVSLSILTAFKGGPKVTLEYKTLIVLWLAFNLQTLISINVPALSIWGWMFSGLILAYGKPWNSSVQNNRPRRSKRIVQDITLLTAISCLSLVSITAPLVARDIKLANAFRENQYSQMIEALLVFPQNANQMARVALAYQKLGNDEGALNLAKLAISVNPNSPKAWEILFDSRFTNPVEKSIAKKELNYRDPFLARGLEIKPLRSSS